MRSGGHTRDDESDSNDNEHGEPSFIRQNVKALRELTGLSQLRFGVEAGTNVKQIETGDRKGNRWDTLAKIARAGGVPLWWLYVDRSNTRPTLELQQFMETPTGKRVRPEEYDILVALPVMLNRYFSYEAFCKAYEMLESSKSTKTDDED